MELIYCALLLYKAGKTIDEANIRKVLDAAGVKKSDGEIKGLVVAMQDLDIEKAIKEATIVPIATPTVTTQASPQKEAKKEEPKEDIDKAAAGLSSLFG